MIPQSTDHKLRCGIAEETKRQMIHPTVPAKAKSIVHGEGMLKPPVIPERFSFINVLQICNTSINTAGILGCDLPSSPK